jgi:hypothetical protein
MENTPREDPTSMSFQPTRTTFNHINTVLMRHNIKTVGIPPKKVASFLWPMKGDLGLKTPDIYSNLL